MLWAVSDRIAVQHQNKPIMAVYVKQDSGICCPLGQCLARELNINISELLKATGVPKRSIYLNEEIKSRQLPLETTDGSTCMEGDHQKLRLVIVTSL